MIIGLDCPIHLKKRITKYSLIETIDSTIVWYVFLNKEMYIKIFYVARFHKPMKISD